MLQPIGYRPRWRVSAGLLVAVLFALVLPAPAGAGTILVTTTFDQLDGSAPCSLREAVNTANADANSGGCTDANPAAADTIRLAAHDYNLQRGAPSMPTPRAIWTSPRAWRSPAKVPR